MTEAHIGAAGLFSVLAVTVLCLGIAPLLYNPWKRTHQVFGAFAMTLSLYYVCAACIHMEVNSPFPVVVGFLVLLSLPPLFCHFVMCLPLQRIEGSVPFLCVLYATAALAAFWPPSTHAVQHLPGAAALAYGLGNLTWKLRTSNGVHYRQVTHTLTAAVLATAFGIALEMNMPTRSSLLPGIYGAGAGALFCGWCAVALVRYHLASVPWVFLRLSVAVVLATLVTLCILAAIGLGEWLIPEEASILRYAPATLAALLTALVIQPAKDMLEGAVHRYIVKDSFNEAGLVARVTRSSVTKRGLQDLLGHAGEDIRQSMHAGSIRIWLRDAHDSKLLLLAYSSEPTPEVTRDGGQRFLLDYLEAHPGPLILERMLHRRPTPKAARAAKHLAALDAYMLAPLRSRAGISGFIALSEKRDKDIYTANEARALATAATPLAQAIQTVRLYDELAEINERLEGVLSAMRGGVVALDAEGQVAMINREACRLLPGVSVGASSESFPTGVRELLERAEAEDVEVPDAELLLGSAEKDQTPVAVSLSRMKHADGVHGTLLHLYDMTEIRQLEWTVRRADRLTAIGTLAAGMAHEIKNPLQSIKTFTQLLLERFDDPDFRMTYAEVVPPEVERIDGIVSRLLHFARPQPVRISNVNVCNGIRQVLALVGNELEKAEVETDCDFPKIPAIARGDEQQLHQVFLNLILNAIEAMGASETRRLGFQVATVRAVLPGAVQAGSAETDCLRIVVSDTGRGVDKESLEQLFTPFYTTTEEGSGLGLAVVHGIVAEHGGEISVSSIPGNGTSISILLPEAGETAPAIGGAS